MGAVVSLDGFIADDNDGVGPLFDWYGNGDVSWSFEGSDGECRTTQASADFMRAHYAEFSGVSSESSAVLMEGEEMRGPTGR